MANYYTYGKIPNVEETVYGPLYQGYADGGEAYEPVSFSRGLPEEEPVGPSPLSLAEDEPVPADQPLPDEPYYSEPTAPTTPIIPPPNIFVDGATTPESTGMNMSALDEAFANLRKSQELQKLALEPGLLRQGFTGTSGVTAPPAGAGIKATSTAPTQPPIDFDITPEMESGLREVAKPAEITDAEREAVTSNPRVQALQRISDQLKSNDFAGAFDTALAAERDLGGDFVGNIVDANKLRELRGPMTAEEITKFYNEMPQKVFEDRYLGPGNEFSKEQAIERNIAALGGEAGYVDPMLGVKKEETLLSKLPIKELTALAAAAMGATAIPGLLGGTGGGAGGAAGGAGAAGGTAGGAGAAAGGAGALTGVVPTGLIPGAASAAGLGTATFPIIASGGLTAAELAALTAAGLGGASAVSGGSAAGPTTTTTPTTEPPLEEVVVTGAKPPVIPPAAVVAPVVGALTPQPPAVEPPLEEVVIEAKKPVEPEISVPPPITPPSAPVEPVAPEGPLEEVVVETTKPTEPPVVVPPVVTTPTSPVDTAFPEGPVEEVVVETTKPTEPPIVTPPIVTTPTTPVDTAFPEGPVEEVVVETTKPTPEKPIIPPVVVPPTTPVDIPKEPPKVNEPSPTDKIKDLLAKYGDLETLLKLLGALGAAGSKTKPVTTPTAPTGGMGGALPKYVYTRKQLSPDIDYYTYGTRPEAKFFEDTVQLEKPAQPELPPAKPPEEDKPMAVGGLTGYAEGGSKESRYVDGPGSGRDDKIPALLSDGEYVMDAETLALLGDGSTKEGARRMDEFRAKIRQHKGRALSRGQISPDAKSPTEYMGGGLA